jgi:hypothetical protein
MFDEPLILTQSVRMRNFLHFRAMEEGLQATCALGKQANRRLTLAVRLLPETHRLTCLFSFLFHDCSDTVKHLVHPAQFLSPAARESEVRVWR